MSEIKNKITTGVLWSTIETFINRGFGLIIQFVLARLLFPEDYGLVGMAAVFISFLEVFNDLGMNAALVQRKEEKLTPLHFDTVFWTGAVWSLFLFLLMGIFGGSFAAQFYGEEQLKIILPVMSLSILLSPINLIHRAQLTKAMNFKKLALVNNISNISSGIIAVVLAFLDFGVWALVFYTISRAIIAIPLFFNATKWKPTFRWGKQEFKDVFGFGVYTTGTAFLNKLTGNIDYLLVGKLVGSAALGFYTFAFIITNAVRDQIVSIINKVLYPVYASLQDSKEKMLNLFLRIVSINNYVVYPVILGVYFFSENLIPLVFGDKWDNSIPIIKILSIAVLIQMLNNSHTVLLRAAGEVRLEMILQFIKSLIFFVPLISLGVYFYGLEGAAYGFTLATLFSVLLSFYFMGKIFHLRMINLLNAVKVSSGMAVFCLITIEILKTYLDWRIVVGIYLLFVAAVYYVFGKQDIMNIINIIKRKKKVV